MRVELGVGVTYDTLYKMYIALPGRSIIIEERDLR